MEMDYNLKTFAKFFKFFPCILEKSLKTDYSLFFSEKSPFGTKHFSNHPPVAWKN